MTARRYCLYLTPAMLTEAGYLPAVVVEELPGLRQIAPGSVYAQPWWWGRDWADAKRRVHQVNADLGVTPGQVRQLVFAAARAAFALGSAGDPQARAVVVQGGHARRLGPATAPAADTRQ